MSEFTWKNKQICSLNGEELGQASKDLEVWFKQFEKPELIALAKEEYERLKVEISEEIKRKENEI